MSALPLPMSPAAAVGTVPASGVEGLGAAGPSATAALLLQQARQTMSAIPVPATIGSDAHSHVAVTEALREGAQREAALKAQVPHMSQHSSGHAHPDSHARLSRSRK